MLLTVRYQLRERQGLLDALYEVAADQLVLREDDPAARFAAAAPAGTLRIAGKTVSGEGFSVTFDPKSGFIRSYRLRDVELLAGPLRPSFYRAATDNDLGVRQTGKYPDSRMWAEAEPELVNFTLTSGDGGAKAVADYTIPAVGAQLRLAYAIAADGSIRIGETMTADPARKDVADLMRFGMAFETPGMFDAVEYYGRGPMENYRDRKNAAYMGRYKTTVTDMAEHYARAQTMGGRTDTHWLALTDGQGKGLRITATDTLDFSAQHYTDKDLWQVKYGHDLSDIHRAEVVLNLDCIQRGLGNASCGPGPRPHYEIRKDTVYSYSFRMEPLR